MKKKSTYIKCPRCDLNYIEKRQRLCNVCKAELNMLSPSILIPDEDGDEILCPRCQENFITLEEEMCYVCVAKLTEEATLLEEDADSWDGPELLEEVVIDEFDVSLPEEIAEDFAGELEEEEEEEEEVFNHRVDEDDFDDIPFDAADFEYDEDEEDEDDDED